MDETSTREIQRLRGEIVAWRRARYDRAPLPAHLWAQAVDVARRVGINRARHALGLSYQGLQAHVERASEVPAFVEVTGAEVLAAGPVPARGTSIEIHGRDVHIVVRLGDRDVLDLPRLVAVARSGA